MEKIAKFEKISASQMLKDAQTFLWGASGVPDLNEVYEGIKLPERATVGSAGYDFYAPTDVIIMPDLPTVIPTGIRCIISEGWFLAMFPRSGSAFKYGLSLVNTVGIIDSDYNHAKNEGHILLKFCTKERVEFKRGDRIAQGIFLPYGITVDDEAEGERHGGFGSTDKEETHV